MKQIKKELSFSLQDTNGNNIINYKNIPENLLFNNIIYSDIVNYNSGKLLLDKYNDTTTSYTLTFSSSIIFIESSSLINIYLNDSTSPIQSRTFSYDNPSIPAKVCISVPPPSSTLSDYYELDEQITVNYLTGDYQEIILWRPPLTPGPLSSEHLLVISHFL